MSILLVPDTRNVRRYDCGSLGMLTARQIAGLAGIKVSAVNCRVHRGITGEALCAAAVPVAQRKRSAGAGYRGKLVGIGTNGAFAIAVRLALRFPKTPPEVQELLDMLGCSRAQAYRIRRVWLDEHGASR